MKNKQIILTTFCLVVLSMYYFMYFWYKPKVKELTFDTSISNRDSVILNDSVLYDYLITLHVKHPKIVLNQAKLESGNYTSKRFKQYNALFGFQTSEKNILKYDSRQESVIHYKIFQMKRLKEDEDYYEFLIRVSYAQDSLYINKLKQF